MSYNFHWDPSGCDEAYFRSLQNFLDTVDPRIENFRRMNKEVVKDLKIKCEHPLGNRCQPDVFVQKGKKQILLGRFFDTIGCFFECNDAFFAMAMTPYSLFKNDVFIHYMLDHPDLFVNTDPATQFSLDSDFPVRILLSTKHIIPSHKLKNMTKIMEYTGFSSKDAMIEAIEQENKYKFESWNDEQLRRNTTETIPINHIISRELCIMHQNKLHFFTVTDNSTNLLMPYILVSKNPLEKVRKVDGYTLENFDAKRFIAQKGGESKWIAHVRRVQAHANKTKARKNKPMSWKEALQAASKTYKR